MLSNYAATEGKSTKATFGGAVFLVGFNHHEHIDLSPNAPALRRHSARFQG